MTARTIRFNQDAQPPREAAKDRRIYMKKWRQIAGYQVKRAKGSGVIAPLSFGHQRLRELLAKRPIVLESGALATRSRPKG